MRMEEQNRFKIAYHPGVAEILRHLNCVVAITTYQASKVIFIGSDDGKTLLQVPVSFRKPMGIALLDNKMAIATLDEIHIFGGSAALAESFPESPGVFDRLYLPRATYYCGETDLHDLGFGNGGLWAVNTRFSCLSTFDIESSFTPRWKPPFITAIKPQDRCHLNGVAMVDKIPAYVTALSQTDTAEGWRKEITKSGVLMRVPSGEIILEGLPMPHSPRIIDGELYLLLSATGEIIRVDPDNKRYDVLFKANAFVRGMAYHANYLFVGMSQARKSSKTFNELPVSEMSDSAGVLVIDMTNWTLAGEIRYQSTVEEIYDVQVIPGTSRPGLIPVNDERHKSAIVTKEASFWKKSTK